MTENDSKYCALDASYNYVTDKFYYNDSIQIVTDRYTLHTFNKKGIRQIAVLLGSVELL